VGDRAATLRTPLAIDGGTPVRDRMLLYGHQVITDEDVAAVSAVLRSDYLTTGPEIDRFERDFAGFVGARHAVAMNSGTAALHAAAVSAGIGEGDEVIVPPLTFAATANCVRYVGGRVVFADVRAETLTIDPGAVKSALTSRTKAIIAVDYGGQPADLDELMDIAEQRKLILIEDAAHAIGATYRERPVGSIAHLTTFSLHAVKQMTSGEGGVVTTNDAALADAMRTFRNHGIARDARAREKDASWEYDLTELGFNYRLTDMQAALAASQLRRLPAALARRREIVATYLRELSDIDEIELLAREPDRLSGWHLFVVKLRLDRLRVDRRTLFRALRAENIGVNVHYIPVPWFTYYRDLGYARGGWPVAEAAYERLLTLPLWAGMTDGDVADVVAALRKVIGAYRA
jgi:perosamine synthetase